MKKTIAMTVIALCIMLSSVPTFAGVIGFTNGAGNFYTVGRISLERDRIMLTEYKSLEVFQAGLGKFDKARSLVVKLPTLDTELAKPADNTKTIRRNYLLAVYAALKAVEGYEALTPVTD